MPLPSNKSDKERNHLKKKYLWYGDPKSGKSTTAANFGDEDNKQLFFACEPGHSELSIYKWEREDGHQPQDWNDFITCCRELYQTDQHDFKMLVIDTVDILWDWCTKYICKMNEISHPSEMGFGKAYQAISAEFSNVCNKLGQRGMGFIFISHKKEYEIQIGPRKESCINTTLPSGAQKFIHGFVDYIWYFTQNQEGQRYILTDRHNNINAGSRGDLNLEPLPLKMPMDSEVVKKLLSREEPRKTEVSVFEFEDDDIEI